MKHAGPKALDALEALLSTIRTLGVTESRRGVFYRKGRAWLHFHEDDAGLFADLRLETEWIRFRVSEREEQAVLLTAIGQDR